MLWRVKGGHPCPGIPLAVEPDRGSPRAQTTAAHTALCFPPALTVPSHVPSKYHLQHQRQRLEGCATGFSLLRAAKGCPQGFPNPSQEWLGGQGAGASPESSSGGHEKRKTDTYPGSSQTDFFLLLKISIPQWGYSCDRGLFIFMLTTSWFPIPLAL